MEHVKNEHEKHVAGVENAFREQISKVEEKGANENNELTAKYEKKIEKLDTSTKAQIRELKETLEST